MGKQLVIDPITRIEGHSKITIQLNGRNEVETAMFHVTQFRGFEKMCQGRPLHEMPSIMARICGICPVSHLVASAKACDAILSVRIPETAYNLRRLMNLTQLVQSHALSFFHLSSPDLLFGMDSDPADRNIFGVLKRRPELARDGVRLRQIGQRVIEILGGKRVHPAWIVPGGVNEPLSEEARDSIAAMLPDGLDIIRRTLDWFKKSLEDHRNEFRTFGNFPSMFMGLVRPDGSLETYDGKLRIADSGGNVIVDQFDPSRYAEIIGEAVEPWTYLKFPYYKPNGYPNGIYRVGPLARLNIIDCCGEPLADQEWAEFRTLERGAVLSSFHYHYARLIEILLCLERMRGIVNHPDILNPHVRAFAEPNQTEGVGVSEAPRGTLLHHYKVDEKGLVTWINLVIATGHNNLAMNKGVEQVAKHHVNGEKLEEGMLNRVEAVIRAYDPCLSCSTHAAGKMPLHIQLVRADGEVVDELKR